jgi:predicted nucleic acid-binding protein
MNGVDTNIPIYSLDQPEPVKRAKARDLLRQLRTGPTVTVLLWQVVGEFVRHLRTWQNQGQITPTAVQRYVILFRRFFPLVMPTPAVLDRAMDLFARHSLSHWDSMLLGACIEAGVDTLYTEDMGAPIQIDSVKLINPFI